MSRRRPTARLTGTTADRRPTVFNHPALIELHAEARVSELRHFAGNRPSWLARALRASRPEPEQGRRAAPAPSLSRPRSDP